MAYQFIHIFTSGRTPQPPLVEWDPARPLKNMEAQSSAPSGSLCFSTVPMLNRPTPQPHLQDTLRRSTAPLTGHSNQSLDPPYHHRFVAWLSHRALWSRAVYIFRCCTRRDNFRFLDLLPAANGVWSCDRGGEEFPRALCNQRIFGLAFKDIAKTGRAPYSASGQCRPGYM